MKTETTSAPVAPGNQSVRQLAATLTKTTPAPSQAKTEPGTPVPPEPKEETPTPEPAEAPETPESLTTVETTETPTEAEVSPDAETAPEVTEEPAAALPKELLEAIEIAKAQDGGKGKAEMLKRIHKLTDARDTERNARLQLEEQTANLRNELIQARQQTPQTAAPVGIHPEVHKAATELANVDHWLGWCEENLPKLQSGELETVEAPDGKGGKIQVGFKDVAKTKRDLENIRQEVVARKVQTEKAVKDAFDTAYNTSHQAALTKFPQLKDPNSDWSVKAKQIINAVPGIKSFPDHEILIGHFLRGMELDAAAGKGAAAPATRKAAPSREPAKVTTTAPGSGAEPDEPAEKKVKQSSQQFQKSGSMRDLARTLTANRQASRTVKR